MTKQINSDQRNELIDQYVEIQVDNMDWKTLAVFVTEELQYRFRNDYTDKELREEINNYDEELYDELVDNVNIEDEDAKLQHLEEIKYDREVN